MNRWMIAAALLLVLLAACCVLWYRRRMKKIMEQMDRMLDAAIDGTFTEELYDESLQSSVEAKLAKYLSASLVSAKNLSEEKEKIKSLIADISHQTKTPIANLLLYAQLLREQELDEKSTSCVEELNVQAEKLHFLIDSLVKISRLESGVIKLSPKENPLQPMLEKVCQQVRPKAEQKSIQIAAEPTDLNAYYDEKWTTEALYNIVDNAVKYTPEGGKVSLKCMNYDLFLRIDVTDSGIGIPEEEQSKIFGRFYRGTKVSGLEGVGIGLYLSRQILAEQGGYIKVRSKVGEGSTFSLFLSKL